jgi:phosphomannomutase
MDTIKFGTDGWRGVIARDFTLSAVAKFSYGLARWLAGKYKNPSAVIGYDTRFGGEMFLEAVAKVLASKNIRVFISEKFVTSPMVSLGVVRLKASCGVMITASHSPAEYNGIKLKGDYGGPIFDKDIRDIENLISSEYEFDLEMLNWNYFIEHGLIQYINLESVYLKNLIDNFDVGQLNASKFRFAFDAMFGSAQNIFRKLMPGVQLFHCEVNPSFQGIPPEPLSRNLHQLEEMILQDKNIDCALAVDGDGDRIALYDEMGNYIDSHHTLLLLIHYMAGYKKLKGKVIAGLSLTNKIDTLCRHHGLEVVRTAIGFKEIAAIMIREEILVAGEESGGMTTGNYIPDRDGIWSGLCIWEWMAATGKKLSELVAEVHAITGSFAFERMDLELNKNVRNKIIESCKNDQFSSFGEYSIAEVDKLDGFKYKLSENEWVMIRASGTGPLIRIYAEAENREKVVAVINAVVNHLSRMEEIGN